MNEVLVKRLKSFAWRLGMILAVTIVDFTAKNVGAFDMPPVVVTMVGLGLAEVSKYLNTKQTTV